MINCIVAVEKNQGIGQNGQMPWPRLKHDLNWFKTITTGNIVIMGSVTYKGLGKPLPNRINVVITKNPLIYGDHTFNDCNSALDFCTLEYPDKEIFIIGGSAIYNEYMDVVDRFYITEIDENYQCDRFFDLDFVKRKFKKIKEYATYLDPIKYTIKEYS